jgi:hypothetical protein
MKIRGVRYFNAHPVSFKYGLLKKFGAVYNFKQLGNRSIAKNAVQMDSVCA